MSLQLLADYTNLYKYTTNRNELNLKCNTSLQQQLIILQRLTPHNQNHGSQRWSQYQKEVARIGSISYYFTTVILFQAFYVAH